MLLNDIQFVEASRVFAERILHELPNASGRERVYFAFEVVTSRPPKHDELRMLLRAYDEQRRTYRGRPEAAIALLNVGDSPRDTALDAAEHAALTTITNLIFNLSEALTKS